MKWRKIDSERRMLLELNHHLFWYRSHVVLSYHLHLVADVRTNGFKKWELVHLYENYYLKSR